MAETAEVSFAHSVRSAYAKKRASFIEVLMKWPRFIGRRPCVALGVSLLFMLVMGGYGGFLIGTLDSNQAGGVFVARDVELVKRADTVGLLRDSVVPYDKDTVLPALSIPTRFLSIYYITEGSVPFERCLPFLGCSARPVDEKLNIFTPDRLDYVRRVQTAVEGVADFGDFCFKAPGSVNCTAPQSPLPLFFPAAEGGATLNLTAGHEALVAGQDFGSFFYVDKDYAETGESTVTRSIHFFGGPLPGYDNPLDREEEQDAKFEAFSQQFVDLLFGDGPGGLNEGKFAYTDPKARTGQLHFGSGTGGTLDIELGSIVGRDLSKIGISVVAVYAVMLYQFRNPVLAFLGLIQAVLSYPSAYVPYVLLWRHTVDTSVNQLALYVVLAIGADDLFLLFDAWRQYKVNANDPGNSVARLEWAWRRAGSAMSITTLTTTVAFGATAFSPVPALASFGQLASATVVFNFFYTLTVFPAVLVCWSRFVSRRGRRKVTAFRAAAATQEQEMQAVDATKEDGTGDRVVVVPAPEGAAAAADVKPPPQIGGEWADGGVSPDADVFPFLMRFFHKNYAVGIYRARTYILGASVLFIVFMGAFAVQLRPDSAVASIFDQNFSLSQIARLDDEVFSSDGNGVGSAKVLTEVVFGIDTLDRKDSDPNDAEYVGVVVPDKTFDATSVAAQEHFDFVCDRLARDVRLLAKVDESEPTECVWHAFMQWRNESDLAFPIADPADVAPSMSAFLITPTGLDYAGDVGLNKARDEIEWMILKAFSRLTQGSNTDTIRVDLAEWQQETRVINRVAPTPDANKAFIHNNAFVLIAVFDALLGSTVSGVAISGVVAAVILAVSLGPRMAVLGMTSIGFVLISLLGAFVIFNQPVNIIESFTLSIVIGVAVDYSVHLAHAYENGHGSTRFLRTQYALTTVGSAILGGALSSSLAVTPLFLTTLVVLRLFGVIFCVIIVFSFVSAMVVLTTLLMLFGPVEAEEEGKDTTVYKVEENEAVVKGSAPPAAVEPAPVDKTEATPEPEATAVVAKTA